MSRLLQSRLIPSFRRPFSTSTVRTAFATGPAPPRLPPKEQEEFERLQRSSTGAFSTPRPAATTNPNLSPRVSSRPQINQSSASAAAAAATATATATAQQINQSPASQAEADTNKVSVSVSAEEIEVAAVHARVQATGKGEELHPDVRRGAKPEFEGDVNPVTGEVGGPKNEPLRWGSTGQRGDWSYNGRVTDF